MTRTDTAPAGSDPTGTPPPGTVGRMRRRLAIGLAVLTIVWGVSFNVDALPFLPAVVGGGVLAGAMGVWARRTVPPGRLPTLRVSPGHAALAVAVALAHVVVGHLLFDVADALVPAVGDGASRIYRRTDPVPLLPRLVLSGLLTAPLEELFWRGGLHPAIREATAARAPRLPRSLVAIAVGALVYTVFHVVTWNLSLIAAAALGGILWGWLLERTGSVGATMIAHAVWTSLMVLYPAM